MAKVTDYFKKDDANFIAFMKGNSEGKVPFIDVKKYAEALVNIPYDRMKEYLADKTQDGDKALEQMIANITDRWTSFYKNEGEDPLKDKNATPLEKTVMKYCGKDTAGKTTREKYNLLRTTYIKTADEIDKAKTEYFTVNSINNCLKTLSDADSKFRGSSDEYKEIQKELKELLKKQEEFSNGTDLIASDGGKLYIGAMMNVLAEKADKYVAARKKIELEHSSNGYKGKRINAMRSLANMLRAYAADIQMHYGEVSNNDLNAARIAEAEYKAAEAEKKAAEAANKPKNVIYELNANFGIKLNEYNFKNGLVEYTKKHIDDSREFCKKKLAVKFGRMEYNTRLFAETLNNEKNIQVNFDTVYSSPIIKAMKTALAGERVSYGNAKAIFKTVTNEHLQYKDSLKNLGEQELAKMKTELQKSQSEMVRIENMRVLDDMVFEKDGTTKSERLHLTEKVRIQDRLNCIQERQNELKKDVSKDKVVDGGVVLQ